jgi:tetratricopeptide (TPR) repeat protein
MNKNFRKSCVALAGAVTLTLAAQAQYRVDTGNARDANNRVGSGGINDTVRQGNVGARFNGVSSSDVVYGNVTGGKEFRGGLQSTDPRAFRGFTVGGTTDRFIRSSSSGFYGSNSNTTQAFYGDSRGVAPPEGFVKQGYAGGYIPAPLSQRSGSDLRLGDVLDSPVIESPRPGELTLPGPVDNSNTNLMLSASPLYGIRSFRADAALDQTASARYSDLYRGLLETRTAMDQDSLARLRNDLNNQSIPANEVQGQDATKTTDPNLAQPLGTPAGSPKNDPLPSSTLAQGQQASPLDSSMQTNQGNRLRLLVQAGEQTPELQALQRQYIKDYGAEGNTGNDVAAAQDFNAMVRALEAARKASKSGAPQPGQPGAGPGSQQGGPGAAPGTGGPGETTPGAMTPGGTTPGAGAPGGTTPGDLRAPTNAGAGRAKPVQIKSLTTGVKVKEFGDMLKSAEDNMKQGKWITAIEDYDQARLVAPNNPLILIGRANANLGASYYTKAEADLRTAFTSDEALLHGQYDLRGMMGDERIEFIARDLKEIAKKNPNQPRPYFLLSYLYYNIGEERKASGYLALAEKVVTPGDTFYSVVRQHWVLPDADAPAEDQNK